MRMWLVDPKILCKNHLIGEHYEIHKLVSCINLNRSIQGYIDKRICEVHKLRSRHDELVQEMTERGYKHSSDLPDFKTWVAGNVDICESIRDLTTRCVKCDERHAKSYERETVVV